jgi:hypothetical protein
VILQRPVEEEKAVAEAGAKLQWPVVGAGALTEAGGEESPSSSMSISTYPGSRTAELAGARAKAGARAGAEAGAEVRAEAGAFLSEPDIVAEEAFFEVKEAEAAVAEQGCTNFAVKLVAATFFGRIKRKVEEAEEEEEEEEEEEKKEEEEEKEEEGTAFAPLRLGAKAPETFCRFSILFKSSAFFLKGFTPGGGGILCIKARRTTSVIVGKRQEEAAAEVAE